MDATSAWEGPAASPVTSMDLHACVQTIYIAHFEHLMAHNLQPKPFDYMYIASTWKQPILIRLIVENVRVDQKDYSQKAT